MRDISWLVALAGPAVLAIDQIDTLLAQGADRADPLVRGEGGADNSDVEHVAHGLMSIRQNMRRTTAVVACLPTAWEAIRSRATATVSDRFREAHEVAGSTEFGHRPGHPGTTVHRQLPDGRIHAAVSELAHSRSAFDDAPNYTPRLLLQRADTHVRSCLDRNVVEELAHLDDPSARRRGERLSSLRRNPR